MKLQWQVRGCPLYRRCPHPHSERFSGGRRIQVQAGPRPEAHFHRMVSRHQVGWRFRRDRRARRRSPPRNRPPSCRTSPTKPSSKARRSRRLSTSPRAIRSSSNAFCSHKKRKYFQSCLVNLPLPTWFPFYATTTLTTRATRGQRPDVGSQAELSRLDADN